MMGSGSNAPDFEVSPMLRLKRPFRAQTFFKDKSANVAMLFGISALVLIGVTGLGVDYYTAISSKAQLDLAADAASIQAITYVKNYMQANATIPAATAFATAQPLAQAQAQTAFTVNAGKNARLLTSSVFTVARSGQTITASVDYTANSPNAFGPLFGVRNINVTGKSASSLTLPKYVDFYLLLDVSGSMGLPADASGQTLLASLNPDNNNQNPNNQNTNFCAFACHFSGNACTQWVAKTRSVNSSIACQGFSLAASNNITLRAAAVGQAVQAVLTTAQNTETGNGLSNQFRVGIFPFIVNMDVFYPPTSDPNYPISKNLASANTTIANLGGGNGQGLANLLDIGTSKDNGLSLGSGGTHIDNALTSINSTITSVGDGSSTSSTQPFVFLVTDGAQNFQTQSSGSWSTTYTPSYPSSINVSGNSSPYFFDTTSPSSPNWPTLCTQLKNRNITIAVLYLPYVPINPPSTFASDEDYKVNWIIPATNLPQPSPAPPTTIPAILQACASPGFFFTANSTADINNAMQTMFAQAVASAHLTH
jgi:Flp pilus assembly protein TadG